MYQCGIQKFFPKSLKNHGHFLLCSIWLGANDMDIETVFRWTDGTIVSWVNWAPDQPSGHAAYNWTQLTDGVGQALSGAVLNQQNDNAGKNDCIARNADGTWDDVNCGGSKPFYCETTKGTNTLSVLVFFLLDCPDPLIR